MAKIVVPKRRQLPIYAALHPKERRYHSHRGGSLQHCTPYLNVWVTAHSVESIMLVYHARQCLNNIVGRSVMYADFDGVAMEGESLYWFRLDAPSEQSTEYSSIIGNYAEHVGRIFKKSNTLRNVMQRKFCWFVCLFGYFSSGTEITYRWVSNL